MAAEQLIMLLIIRESQNNADLADKQKIFLLPSPYSVYVCRI